MKQGKNLQELAQELTLQKESKRDFISPTKKMTFKSMGPDSVLNLENGNGGLHYPLKPLAEEQIANRLGIPKKYYDVMRAKAPELLETNVNHWLQAENDKLLVRTLFGKTRAILSNRFRPLDNFDLAETVLPMLSVGDVKVESCEITETRMYIKAITPRITTEIVKGDIVQAGIVISNSEVGCGAVKIEPMIYRLFCLNGMISADNSLRKYHVGKGNEEEEFLREYLSDETRKQDDKAFWMKVRDIVKGALSEVIFNKIVDKMREAKGVVIDAKPGDVVEVVKERYQLNEDEGTSILGYLLKEGDLSKYGLVNAVTRASQDVNSYDRATELEHVGGEILELKGKSWNEIAVPIAS